MRSHWTIFTFTMFFVSINTKINYDDCTHMRRWQIIILMNGDALTGALQITYKIRRNPYNVYSIAHIRFAKYWWYWWANKVVLYIICTIFLFIQLFRWKIHFHVGMQKKKWISCKEKIFSIHILSEFCSYIILQIFYAKNFFRNIHSRQKTTIFN